ncbi:ATP-dependent endonuclease [Pseudomonas sp. UMAB-40]|uniref:ATP-dependent nuclease n=1 Tax=Pseudomonas sp. UMAB-40 TaxID=1365407 RepID=UPI001C5870A5|nr:AAA family ATPase [Pseudomonas sp. UMAB-40]
MHLSKVTLVNYRNFERESFLFEKGINTIIGENGAGKSNLFRAIRLLLDSNIYRSAYALDENDFFRMKGSWKGHWIIISLEFDEIDHNEAVQSLFLHRGATIDGSRVGRATYNLIFRPNQSTRAPLSQLEFGDVEGLKNLQEQITISDYEPYFTGRSVADFKDPEIYRTVVGDFKAVKFPAVTSHLVGSPIPNQLSVAREVSFTFIKALRDVVSDFSGNRQNPLLNLLKRKSEEIDHERYRPITDKVKALNNDIEVLSDVQEVRFDILDTIAETAGEAYSPAGLHIKSDLPSEADKLFQSLKLFVGENDENYAGDISELSLGGANLIYLTLKLLEFKYQKQRETVANFLIIEEPEAHIHTHIQKTLFGNIKFDNTQIIYSTHSTHISEASNVEKVNVLARKGLRCESYQPATGLSVSEIRHLQRYLDATRSSLLFAKGVMLIEGDAEEIMIPALVKEVLGISLDELGVSLINIRSTGFENVACVFHKTRIKRYCSIITDLDAAIAETEPLVGDKPAMIKYKRKMAASEKAGLSRKVRLDNFCRGNRYMSVHYADHTFEVDFVKCGNEEEVADVVDTVYEDESTKILAKKEINSGEIAAYGKRVLTMATNAGKGWFAIQLAEKVGPCSTIPNYILNAVFNAQPEISDSLRLRIIKYRIKTLKHFAYFEDYAMAVSEAEEQIRALEDNIIDYENVMNALELIFPEDHVIQKIVGV